MYQLYIPYTLHNLTHSTRIPHILEAIYDNINIQSLPQDGDTAV